MLLFFIVVTFRYSAVFTFCCKTVVSAFSVSLTACYAVVCIASCAAETLEFDGIKYRVEF